MDKKIPTGPIFLKLIKEDKMAYDNRYKRTFAKSPLDYDRELLVTKNRIKWNSWMKVLARCPRYEEEGVLRELVQLNDEFRVLISK